ncbi:unnamed protein product [Rhizopus stolonifer]
MLYQHFITLFALFIITALCTKNQIIRVPLKQKRLPNQLIRRQNTYNSKIYNNEGSLYLISVSVGTPPQTFDLALDTGSSDLWVPGSKCASSVCPFSKFNQSQSTTFKESEQKMNISYGTGSASGNYVFDTITIAGITVQQQQFGYITQQKNILTEINTLSGSSYTPNRPKLDGIFGLGYPFITSSYHNPFFFNLKQQGQLAQNVFSIYLNNSFANSGEILFGGVDTSMYTGGMHYLPLAPTMRSSQTGYGYWQVYGQGIGVVNSNNTMTKVVAFEVPPAFVFDTGTTMSYMPTKVVESLLVEAVGKDNLAYDRLNNYFQINCEAYRSNAMIQLQFTPVRQTTQDPVLFHVPLRNLIFPLDSDFMGSASVCMVGLIPSEGTIFIGQSILRSAYVVYDADQNRLGIAAAVGSGAFLSGPVDTGGLLTSSASLVKKNSGLILVALVIYFIL